MNPYTLSRTALLLRDKANKQAITQDNIRAMNLPLFHATLEMTDEDCADEPICHHIIEALPTEDGGTEARCRNCNRTPTMEELEDWNEDEVVRRGDNKSYFGL